MLIPTLALIAILSPSGPTMGSGREAVEEWVTAQYGLERPAQLSSVKSSGDLICAVDYYNGDYLIDARRHITWKSSTVYPRFDLSRPNPHSFYYLDADRRAQWSRCEKVGMHLAR